MSNRQKLVKVQSWFDQLILRESSPKLWLAAAPAHSSFTGWSRCWYLAALICCTLLFRD